MTRYGTTNQYVVLLREYFHYFQRFYFHAVATHTAGHTHAFKYAAGVRRTTHRTGSALTIVLTVRCFAHTAKAVTLHNTLETFTFRSTYHRDFLSFSKYLAGNSFTYLFINGTITKFFYDCLRRCICLSEVIDLCLRSILFFLFTERNLQCIITVGIHGFLLSNHTRASFDNGTGNLLTIRLKNAGHADFFTNNTFHFLIF